LFSLQGVPQGKMEALRDAMEKKRKEREEAAAAGGGGGKKKWVRRGELEAQREAAYREEMAAAEASRKLVVPCLRRYEGEGDAAAAVDNTGTGAALVGGLSAAARAGGVGAGGASSAGGDMVHLEPKEVKRLLRQLGQPVQLFGEEDEARLERYRAVAAATEKEDDAELKAGQMFNETQLYDESGKAKDAATAAAAAETRPAAVDEEEMGGEEANTVEGTISRHFKGLLRLWEEELSARSEAVANSAAGRKEMATYLQCRRHLKPFFRQLKARVMPPDILRHIETITEHMAARECGPPTPPRPPGPPPSRPPALQSPLRCWAGGALPPARLSTLAPSAAPAAAGMSRRTTHTSSARSATRPGLWASPAPVCTSGRADSTSRSPRSRT